MGRRQLTLAAAACVCAFASTAPRGAHAQLSPVEAHVVSCNGAGSAPSCVPSLQLAFDVAWPAPVWTAVAVLSRGASLRSARWKTCSLLNTSPREAIADSSGALWAPTADILLTVSSAQPGRSDYALTFQRTCVSAFEEDSGVGVASTGDVAASCALPGGGTRSLRRENAALTTFSIAYRGTVYAVAVTATQGAVAASATAEASSAPLQAAPGMIFKLNATAAANNQAVLSSYYLVAANATDEGVLVPAAQVGDGANKLCVSPQSWTLCNPCGAPLGSCATVPAGGQVQRDQLYSFRGTTLASLLSSSRGVACSFVAAASASLTPGGGAASQAVNCVGDGASRAQVTLSLSRFSVVRRGAPPPPPSPPETLAAASVPPPNASMLLPTAAACGAGGACSRASGVNCTCAHGTLATATNGACSCVCDSGWVTNPDQDMFAPVYCGMQAATQAGLGNPEVAAGAVPATALVANNGSSAALLTPSGWALILGISIALLCICFCCFRYGRRRGCGRRADAAKQTIAHELDDASGTPPPRQNSLRAMSDGLRRLLAFRMRQSMLAAVGSHISHDDAAGIIADGELLKGDAHVGQRSRTSNPPLRPSKPRRGTHRARRGSSEDDDSGTEPTSNDGSDEESAKRRHRSGSRAASRRHGPLMAPHPLTPPVLYGSRGIAAPAGAPVPYGMLLSPPGIAEVEHLVPSRMPRPSAPLDPGYSLAVADHAYISYVNGLFAPSAVAPSGGDETAVVMAAAQLVEAYMQRTQGARSPARVPAAAEWPAFSPPQAPSRARTPRSKAAGSPAHPLPTRGQALRSLARELNAASAAAEPVAHARHPRSLDRGSGRSDADEESAAAVDSEADDAFEDFIDGDAEWIAACRVEAAQRQRSPSAAHVGAGLPPPRASAPRHNSSPEPARPGRHRRTLTLA